MLSKYLEKKNRRFWLRERHVRPKRTGKNGIGLTRFGNYSTRQSSDDITGTLKHGKVRRDKITLPKMPWDQG